MPASSRRHRFHQKHFTVLVVVLILAIMIDGVIISFIRKPVLHSGLVLAGAVAIYIVFQRNLKYIKELCAALLYSLGVVLPAWSISAAPMSLSQGLFVAEFCITVLCNLLLFSLFDHQRDLRDHYHSFVTAMGNKRTRFLLSTLFMLNGVLMMLQLFWLPNARSAALAILFMNLMLLMIFIFHERFVANDRYRLVGDAVFLVPLFFFLL